MRALITGVTGFAGSYLAEHLLARGDSVLGCSKRGVWYTKVSDELCDRVRPFAWDIAEGLPPDVVRQVADFAPEAVFHLAAMSTPGDCGAAEPTPDAGAVNVDGTRTLIELCQALPTAPRLLLSSSCYVYAPVSHDSPRVTEHAPLGPTTGYGKTKLAAEEAILDSVRQRRLNAVIARAFQHGGPRQSPKMILPDWARQFSRAGDEPIRALCLSTYLDLSDVRDLVRAYRLLALKGQTGEVYNVGSGICVQSRQIMESMLRHAGLNRDVVELRPGLRQHPIADATKLRRQTNWKPEIPLETTIVDTLKYWSEKGHPS